MEGLPGWVISQMPEPPPRQHKHERQYTPSIHSVIPTRRIWNDDYDGQMILGDLGGLKFPDICLTGGKKTPKKPHPGNLSRPGIEPGPAAWQARMLPLTPQQWTRIHVMNSDYVTFSLLYHRQLARWPKWRTCVVETKEGLENELWRSWNNGRLEIELWHR